MLFQPTQAILRPVQISYIVVYDTHSTVSFSWYTVCLIRQPIYSIYNIVLQCCRKNITKTCIHVDKRKRISFVRLQVGYHVRFENNTSPLTQIKYMTDGILLREYLFNENVFNTYSIIIIDEIHERSIQMDLLLGIMKMVRLA